MSVLSFIPRLVMGNVRDRAFTYTPRWVRNREAARSAEAARETLESDEVWGELPRPLFFLQGYNDVPERWDEFRSHAMRKCSNAEDCMLPGVTGRDERGVAELARDFAAFIHEQGADEVDIVAHSMGGLVSLTMAQAGLRVRRLYTLTTPFRGTYAAWSGRFFGAPFRAQLRDLRPRSDVVRRAQELGVPEGCAIRTYHMRGDLNVRAWSAHGVEGEHRDIAPSHWKAPEMVHIQLAQEPRVIASILKALVAKT